jgi:hypothetical protein
MISQRHEASEKNRSMETLITSQFEQRCEKIGHEIEKKSCLPHGSPLKRRRGQDDPDHGPLKQAFT